VTQPPATGHPREERQHQELPDEEARLPPGPAPAPGTRVSPKAAESRREARKFEDADETKRGHSPLVTESAPSLPEEPVKWRAPPEHPVVMLAPWKTRPSLPIKASPPNQEPPRTTVPVVPGPVEEMPKRRSRSDEVERLSSPRPAEALAPAAPVTPAAPVVPATPAVPPRAPSFVLAEAPRHEPVPKESPVGVEPPAKDLAPRAVSLERAVTESSATVAPIMPRPERPTSSPNAPSRHATPSGEEAPAGESSEAAAPPARRSLSIGRIEIRTRAPAPAPRQAPDVARGHQIDPGIGPGLLNLGRPSW
jgi:hypothetical protein